MIAPVQDRLRRVDAVAAEHPRIGILPLGIFLGSERVRPSEIIPVVDMIGERDDLAFIDELLERCVRRRTGGAALAGEEFDDALDLPAPDRPVLDRPVLGRPAVIRCGRSAERTKQPDRQGETSDCWCAGGYHGVFVRAR